MVHEASGLNVAHRSARASLPPFQHLFHTLPPVITGFMEVIIAAFEMQMGPCTLRSKSSAMRLSVF